MRDAAPVYRVLGSLRVVSNGASIDGLSKREARLLAALILHAGSRVGTETLVDLVWSEALPRFPKAALNTLVSRVRSALRAIGQDDAIITTRGGYSLAVTPDAVDAARFEQTVRSDLHPSDPRTASILSEALGLWQGTAYDEVRLEHPVFTAESHRLEELRIVAHEMRIEADLAAGAHQELIPELRALTEQYPLRENLWAHLMVALYRDGQQADALRAFRSLRGHLSAELGIEPSSSLAKLEHDILNQEPGLVLRPTGRDSLRLRRRRHNLPDIQGTTFGRESELEQVTEVLRNDRLAVLTGTPGIGKTRLALEWAYRHQGEYPGGCWWVSIGETASEEELADAIRSVAPMRLDTDAVASLCKYLEDRQALVVLDGLNPNTEMAPMLVTRVLTSCPDVDVLVTSYVGLHLATEIDIRVGPLGIGDGRQLGPAVELFLDRLRRRSADEWQKIDDRCAVDIVSRLDGHPLAIELVAGYSDPSTLETTRDHLDTFLGMDNLNPQAPPEHRTISITMELAERGLDDVERSILRYLAEFDGPFTAQEVTQYLPEDTLEGRPVPVVLARLLDRCWVSAERTAFDVYFRIVQPVRHYLRATTSESQQLGIRHAHLRFVREMVAGSARSTVLESERIVQMTHRLGDIKRSLAQSLDDPVAVVELAMAHLKTTYWTGRNREALESVMLALDVTDQAELGVMLRCYAVVVIGVPALGVGLENGAPGGPHSGLEGAYLGIDFPIQAQRWLDEAEGLSGDAGPKTRALLEWARGVMAHRLGDFTESERRLRGAMEIIRRPGEGHVNPVIRLDLADTLLSSGQLESAESEAAGALADLPTRDPSPFTIRAHDALHRVARARSDWATARRHMLQAEEIAKRMRLPRLEVGVLHRLWMLDVVSSDVRAMTESFGEMLAATPALGFQTVIAGTSEVHEQITRLQHEDWSADACAATADQTAAAVSSLPPWPATHVAAVLGALMHARGRLAEARPLFQATLEAEADYPLGLPCVFPRYHLVTAAAELSAVDDPELARRLLGEADQMAATRAPTRIVGTDLIEARTSLDPIHLDHPSEWSDLRPLILQVMHAP